MPLFVEILDEGRTIQEWTPVDTIGDARALVQQALDAARDAPARILVGFMVCIEDTQNQVRYEGETRANLWGISLVNPTSWVLDVQGGHFTDTIQIHRGGWST